MQYYWDTNFLDGYQELLNRINETYLKIFEPIDAVVRINQQIIERFCTSIGETTQTFFQNISAFYDGISASYMEQLQSVNVMSQTYAELINNISSIPQPLLEIFRSIDFDSLLATVQSENSIEDSEDCIITDSPIIREIDFPDNIVIPIGHNRIKMKTGDFIALLALLFTVFTTLFQSIGNEASQDNASLLLEQNQLLQEQNQLTREQNQLLQEQNEFFLEILESVDTSMSSQAEFFKDMKESLQEQAALFQALPEYSGANQLSPDSYEESPDNSQKTAEPNSSSPDTVQKAAGSTQRSDCSIQPTTDIAPASSNTGYDNE